MTGHSLGSTMGGKGGLLIELMPIFQLGTICIFPRKMDMR